jgi:hypothetical protein
VINASSSTSGGPAELLGLSDADVDLEETAAPVIPRLLALRNGRHMVVGARLLTDQSIPRERRPTKFLAGLVEFVYDLFLRNLSENEVMAFLAAMVAWSVGLLADAIARLQLKPLGVA